MLQPIAQKSGEARSKSGGGSSGAQASNHAQPGGDRLAELCTFAQHERFLLNGDPNIRGIAAQGFAEKSGRGDTDYGEWVALNDECGSNNRSIAAIDGLPDSVADYGDGFRGRSVVLGSEDASAEGADAEGGKIISGDEFGAQGSGGQVNSLTADAETPEASLESGQLLKFRRGRFQLFKQGERIHSPEALRATLDAAIVAVAHAIESGGIGNRQGAKHYRINQSEDGCGAADTQGEREHSGGGEYGRQPKLPQSIAKITGKVAHQRAIRPLGEVLGEEPHPMRFRSRGSEPDSDSFHVVELDAGYK